MDFHPRYFGAAADSDRYTNLNLEPNRNSLGLTRVPNSTWPDVLYVCPDPAGAELEGMPCSATSDYIAAGPRSHHVTGVASGFVDGHVEFIGDDIPEYVMLNLIDVADGAVIPNH